MAIKTKVNYENCSIYVLGMEMNCPLCGVLVKSGENHQCSRPEIEVKSIRKPKKLRAARVSGESE